jgi:drug/metabolite transporter (DMT)-like permease
MYWLVLALISALGESTKDFFSKNSLKKVDEYVAAWGILALTFPFLLPLLLFVPIPQLDNTFWLVTCFVAVSYMVSLTLFMRAIKSSQLSLTVPMLAFTPVFMLLISFAVLGEFPGTAGLAGVLLIVAGAYVLNASEAKRGLLEPILALGREPGPRLMLVVSVLFGINATLGKLAVLHSNPVAYMVILYGLAGVLFTAFILFVKRNRISDILGSWKTLVLAGLCMAIGEVAFSYSYTMTLAIYTLSVKRTSILFSSLFGFVFFKEKNMWERLAGIAIMLAGVAILAFA